MICPSCPIMSRSRSAKLPTRNSLPRWADLSSGWAATRHSPKTATFPHLLYAKGYVVQRVCRILRHQVERVVLAENLDLNPLFHLGISFRAVVRMTAGMVDMGMCGPCWKFSAAILVGDGPFVVDLASDTPADRNPPQSVGVYPLQPAVKLCHYHQLCRDVAVYGLPACPPEPRYLPISLFQLHRRGE